MNMHIFPVRNLLVGLSTLILTGFSGYQLVRTGIAHAATTPCLVTVFGHQYDVAALQTSHSGGNIFACGTDMTAMFQSKHGTDVSRLAQYLVVSTTPTPTQKPGTTITPTPTGARVVLAVEDEQEIESEKEEEDDKQEAEEGTVTAGSEVRVRSEHSGETTLMQQIRLQAGVQLKHDSDEE